MTQAQVPGKSAPRDEGVPGSLMAAPLRSISIEDLNLLNKETLMRALGIEFTAAGKDFLRARMPVDARTRQTHGILHGGASAALAETLASVGAHLAVDPSLFRCVGLELNANHVRGVRSGWVSGTARPLHLGRSTQVWDIQITDDDDLLVCVSRLTLAVLPLARQPDIASGAGAR